MNPRNDLLSENMDIVKTKTTYIGLFILYAMLAFSFLSPIASDKVVPEAATGLEGYTRLVVQAGRALKEGQFPLRITPIEHTGLGYPEFQFYSPLTYTVVGYIYNTFTPKNPFLAFKITIWLGFIIAAFYIFRLAKQITQDSIASTLAGVSYIAAPYVLINMHVRGATPELIGQFILPIVLYYTCQPFFKKKLSLNSLIISGLMWAALAMTHLITFVNTSIMIGFFLLFIKTESRFKKLIFSGLAYLYGFLLAAWYLGPVILYQHLLNISDTLINPTSTNFLTLFSRLCAVVNTSPVTTASYARTGLDLVLSPPCYPAVGLITLLSVGLCSYMTWIKTENFKHLNENLTKPLLLMFFLAFFLTWSPFDFWKFLPKILVIEQFSYRFLAQVVWIGALIVGLAIKIFTKGRYPIHSMIIGLVVICLSSSSWLMAEYDHAIPMSSIVSDPNIYNTAFLMKQTPQLNNESNLEPLIMDHMTINSHCNKIKDKLSCKFLAPTEGIFELPVIYYPNLLTITLDGKKVSYLRIKFEGYYLAGLKLKPGQHHILIKFTGLAWANWLSLMALFVLIGFMLFYLLNVIFKKVNWVGGEMDLI